MPSFGLGNVLKAFIEELAYTELDSRAVEQVSSAYLLKLVEEGVALEVAESVFKELSSRISGRRVSRLENKKEVILGELRNLLKEIFSSTGKIDLWQSAHAGIQQKGYFAVVFLGPNGHGKTTTVAKLAYLFKQKGYRVAIAAADTFRAGAIEQAHQWGSRIGVDVVSLGYNADPAAVAYEAIKRGERGASQVILIDTAGRMHTKKNLMDEMKKIIRVAQPDLRIFVGDALVGNDAVEQAKTFHSEVGFDGSILTKFDADTKGGAALSIIYVTRKPILFAGVGPGVNDLKEFDPELYLKMLLD
ncbi:MAG: signal recognition particle-docking protein FtsY [Thermofilum sp.]|jgi:fused signal recognition particle receptor|nr:signal recognition particle-docking protein FtsY [Thermofilum sp.]